MLALAAPLSAFEIRHDDWSLVLRPRIQSRVELVDVRDETGAQYDLWDEDAEARDVNLYLRRVRVGFQGAHADGWKFRIVFKSDNIGRDADSGGTKWISHHFKDFWIKA